MIDSKSSENSLKRKKAKSAANSTKHSHRRNDTSGGFDISYLVPKAGLPRLPYRAMKERVLGPSYELSLVFTGDAHAKLLNHDYRGKTYIPNVLSFPVSPTAGEIFLNPSEAKRQHHKRGESFRYFIALLFIHSLLHLKGMAHGGKMEGKEASLLKEFGIVNTFAKKSER